MTNSDKRKFDLPSVATLATKNEPSFSRKMGGVYDLVKFLTGETVTSAEHPAFKAAQEALFKQVLNLEEACVKLPQQGEKKTWFRALEETFGPFVELSRPSTAKAREAQLNPA